MPQKRRSLMQRIVADIRTLGLYHIQSTYGSIAEYVECVWGLPPLRAALVEEWFEDQ
jgi:hypothetical protein